MEVTLNWSELDHVLSELYAHGANLNDLRPVIGEILVTAIDEVFDTEGNGKWKKSQRAELQGGKTLQDTGILAGSISTEYPENGTVAAGTDVPYGIFHLEGTKKMEVRDFLDIDWEGVSEEVSEFLVGEVLM